MKRDKSGSISTFVGMVLTTVIMSTILVSAVNWFLDFSKGLHEINNDNINDTIFYQQVNKIKNIDYINLYDQQGKTITEQTELGSITTSYEKEGIFKDGKCVGNASDSDLKTATQRCLNAVITFKGKDGEIQNQAHITRHSTQMSSAPIGTIVPYYGDINKLPDGWALCDGTNGTPKMTDTFFQGTTTEGNIGKISGENDYKINPENLPNSSITIRNNTFRIIDEGDGKSYSFHSPVKDLLGEVDSRYCDVGSGVYVYFNYITANAKVTNWEGQLFEKQPSYYKLYYIIRLK